jgi:uncharacterized membrane protein
MVTGVVLLALGLKKVQEYVSDSTHHELTDPLTGIGLYALYGGVALYLLALVAFRLRNVHTVNVQRLVMALAVLALTPLAGMLPALAALGMLAGVAVGLIAYEAIRFADVRDRVRHLDEIAVSGPQAAEPPP